MRFCDKAFSIQLCKTDTQAAVWETVSCAAIHTRGVRVRDGLSSTRSDIGNAALILGRYYVMNEVCHRARRTDRFH
jgi:hypothetical protein